MKMPFFSFGSWPVPVKVGAIGVGVLSVLTAAALISLEYVYILIVGMVVVAALLLVYRAVLIWMRKRKAAPLMSGLISNTSATPKGISDPGKLAQLDDLRKKFDEGIQVFRSAGKNIYDLPWYALVGEPGSGKTEAIRHCNVGFPPGLQDQLQGAGGTLNMNWWFTNHAVILDTAGRLMFEEVRPGTSSEWEEFLKLLRKFRPNCPINGMLLVIPADSLIKDTADDLERKGGQIAQQLDHIQRILGVRFPVFLVITKCDLVNGFREFFDTLTDPQLQHQVLGWSNPGNLDQPFNPAEVTQHLNQLREKLLRRRLGLLADPVNTDDPGARRTDQVDALYAFPDSLLKIAPRLRRYLEMIFVSGTWSHKPLFLRGIYFTSAMREGSALDADLAEVLGVPVESLPEGRVWERERAYFLRDLFMKKVFLEKGLVTRANNTRQLQTRRKLAIIGAGFASALFLLLFTWFGASQLETSVGDQRAYWREVEEEFVKKSKRIVGQPFDDGKYEYWGPTPFELGSQSLTLGQFPDSAMRMAQKRIAIPGIFKPVLWFTRVVDQGYDEKRYEAIRNVFEASYLTPLMDATKRKLQGLNAATWSATATDALAQLICMEAQRDGVVPAMGKATGNESAFNLDALFRFVLDPTTTSAEHYQRFAENDRESLVHAFTWLYSSGGAGRSWPPASLSVGDPKMQAVVDAAVSQFLQYWTLPVDPKEASGSNQRMARLLALRDALRNFKDKETRLLKVDDGFKSEVEEPDSLTEFRRIEEEWTSALEELTAAKRAVDEARAALGSDADQPVATVSEQAGKDILDQVIPEFTKLIAATGKLPESKLAAAIASTSLGSKITSALASEPSHLDRVREKLEQGKAGLEQTAVDRIGELKTELVGLEEDFFGKLPRKQERMYEVRYAMYLIADRHLKQSQTKPRLIDFPKTWGQMRKDFDQQSTQIDELARSLSDAEWFKNAAAVSRFMLRLGRRDHQFELFKTVLESVPRAPEDFSALVASTVQQEGDRFEPWARPSILATDMEESGMFDSHYHPEVAKTLFEIWEQVGQQLNPDGSGGAPAVLEKDALDDLYKNKQAGFLAYVEDYLKYWTDTTRSQASIKNFGGWSDLHQKLGSIKAFQVNERIKTLLDKTKEAVGYVPDRLMTDASRDKKTKARKAIESEHNQLTDRFDDICDGVVRNWMGLTRDDRRAVETLKLVLPRDFERDYLKPYREDPNDPGVKYWNDLCFECNRLLADSAQERAVRAIADLSRRFKKFPLCLTTVDKTELTPEQVQEARQILGDIGSIYISGDASGGGEKTIGQGGKTSYDKINDQLDKLSGRNVLGEPKVKKWYEQLLTVSNALQLTPPLNGNLVSIPQDQQTPPGGSGATFIPYRYLEVRVGAQAQGTKLDTYSGWTNGPAIVHIPGEELTFLFYHHLEDKEPAATVTVAKPWTLAAAIHQFPSEAREGGKLWKIALPVGGAGGDQKFFFWIGLEFNRALPGRDDWPTDGNWPRD